MQLHIGFHKRKTALGIAMALAAFVTFIILDKTPFGIFLAILYIAAGTVTVQCRNPFFAAALNILWGMLSIFTVSIVSPLGGLLIADTKIILLNFLCAFLVTELLYLITAKWRFSINFSVVLLAALALANTMVYQFRGKELAFTDLFSLETALNVATRYQLRLPKRTVFFCFLCIWCLFTQVCIPPLEKPKTPVSKLRLVALFTAAATATTVILGAANVTIKTWDIEGSSQNGYYLNFYLGIRDSCIRTPENYSLAQLDDYACAFSDASHVPSKENRPNIIIILDEAFGDFSIFEKELRTNTPVTPFIDALQDNTVRGYALCSVFGGTTANTEFELLTGHSMAFLPTASVPYQQYIDDNIFSLGWLLDSYGYTTFATHPYLANGWSRPTVYPLLGFDTCTFLEDYPQEDLLRGFVSDREMFAYVLQKLEKKSADAPLFLFGITMQNHSGYTYAGENWAPSIQLTGYSQAYPMAEQYLSLIHETDKALSYLIAELEEFPEDTVVLFLGDHLPRVEEGFYQELSGGTMATLDQQMLQYQVPFFIWANYDIEEQFVDCTSINYLGAYLLECAGLPLPPYYQLLKDTEKVIPAVSANAYYSLQAGGFQPLEEATGIELEYLSRYENLQYNNLFDSDNRNDTFFSRYMDSELQYHSNAASIH